MSRVVISPTADVDIEEAVDYLAERSPAAAARLFRNAHRKFRKLAAMPLMGSPRSFPHVALKGLRSWAVPGFPNHLIFYREIPDGIEAVRVLHAARDLEHVLSEEAEGE